MDKLLTYLNSLSKDERLRFAVACGTSEGYLRKAISIGQQLSSDLCIKLERESGRTVMCEDLRPDVDWAFIRGGAASAATSRRATDLPIESGRQGRQPPTRKNVMELTTTTPPVYEKKESP